MEKTFDSEVKRLSIKYQVNEKIARKIIKCESHNNPTAIGLSAVVGRDIGYFQLNTYFHTEEMRKLGWDINVPWDNLEYGFYLMKKEGYKPWYASSKCWSNNSLDSQ